MGSIQQEDGISKNNFMLLGSGAFVYILNILWYGYPCVAGVVGADETHWVIDFFEKKLGVFSTPYITLAAALVLILLYAWGHRRPKTSKYAPPVLMRWLIPLLVKLGLHPEFEYESTSDKNGKPVLEKKRERIEGQSALCLGVFLVLISPLPLLLFPKGGALYVVGFLLYLAMSLLGILYTLLGADLIHSMNNDFSVDDSDSNNDLQESFLQCQE